MRYYTASLLAAAAALASATPDATRPLIAVITQRPLLAQAQAALEGHPDADHVKRQFQGGDIDMDDPRQSSCYMRYQTFVRMMPTPADLDLGNWIATETDNGPRITGPLSTPPSTHSTDMHSYMCGPATPPPTTSTYRVPDALASAFSSYSTQVMSFYDAVAPAASAVADECGGRVGAMIDLFFAEDYDQCIAAVDDFITPPDGVTRTATSTSSGADPAPTSGGGGGGDGDSDEPTGSPTEAPSSTPTPTGAGARSGQVSVGAAVLAVVGLIAAL